MQIHTIQKWWSIKIIWYVKYNKYWSFPGSFKKNILSMIFQLYTAEPESEFFSTFSKSLDDYSHTRNKNFQCYAHFLICWFVVVLLWNDWTILDKKFTIFVILNQSSTTLNKVVQVFFWKCVLSCIKN